MSRARLPATVGAVTSRRAVLLLVLAVLLALGLLGAAGVQALQDRWAWRQADLDRNRLNLAISRGAESAEQLASWVEHGSVEDAAGSVQRARGGDGWLRVRYERRSTGWLGQQGDLETVCYLFTSRDGYRVVFTTTRCGGS